MVVFTGTTLALTGLAASGLGVGAGSFLSKKPDVTKQYTNQNQNTYNRVKLLGKNSELDLDQSSLQTAKPQTAKKEENKGEEWIYWGLFGVGAYILYQYYRGE